MNAQVRQCQTPKVPVPQTASIETDTNLSCLTPWLTRALILAQPGYFSPSRRSVGGEMTITGIFSAILIGIVVGVIGRLACAR
jgi:hypothetical protein